MYLFAVPKLTNPPAQTARSLGDPLLGGGVLPVGLSARALGEMSGSETVTLLSTQMPQHDHPMIATTGAANTKEITPNVEFGAVSGDTMYTNDVTGVAAVATASTSTSMAGRNLSHDNLMPTLTVQFCIAFNGIYPSRG